MPGERSIQLPQMQGTPVCSSAVFTCLCVQVYLQMARPTPFLVTENTARAVVTGSYWYVALTLTTKTRADCGIILVRMYIEPTTLY